MSIFRWLWTSLGDLKHLLVTMSKKYRWLPKSIFRWLWASTGDYEHLQVTMSIYRWLWTSISSQWAPQVITKKTKNQSNMNDFRISFVSSKSAITIVTLHFTLLSLSLWQKNSIKAMINHDFDGNEPCRPQLSPNRSDTDVPMVWFSPIMEHWVIKLTLFLTSS